MRTTYRVKFIDARDGYPNEKLLEAECVDDVCAYMRELGHNILSIETA